MPGTLTRGIQEGPHVSPGTRCVHLRPLRNESGLEPIIIGLGEVVLGSDPQANAQLSLEGVAGRHCAIHFDGQQALVHAISPFTWLNEGPVREAPLKEGDLLAIGPAEYQVRYVDVPLPPPPPRDEPPPPRDEPTPPSSRSPLPEPANPSADTSAAPPVAPLSVVPVPPPAARGPARRPGRGSSRMPDAAEDVQPLLDEAEAARRLQESLQRLERDLDRHRRRATAPPATPPSPSQEHRSQREERLREREQAVALREAQCTLQQQELEQQRRTIVRQVEQLKADSRELQALQSRWQERLRTLEAQAATLAAHQAEFDAAVETLDADRAALEAERREFERCATAERDRRDQDRRERDRIIAEAARLREQAARSLEELAAREAQLARHAADLAARDEAQRQAQEQLAKRQTQLEQETQRLSAEQQECDRRRAELTAAETDLQRRAETLRTRETQLERHARELDRLKTELLAERDALRKESQRLADAAQELVQHRTELEQRERDLDSRAQTLAERERQCDEQAAASRQQMAQCEARARELDAQRELLARQRSEWEAEVLRHRNELEAERRQLATDRDMLEQLTQRWDGLQAELEQRDAQLKEREARLREQAPLTAELKSADEQLARRRIELAADAEQLAVRTRELDAREADLARRAEELERQRAELQARVDAQADRERLLTDHLHDLEQRERRCAEREALASVPPPPDKNGDVEALLEQIQELQTEMDRLRSDRSHAADRLHELQQAEADVRRQRAQLHADAQALDEERRRLGDLAEQLAIVSDQLLASASPLPVPPGGELPATPDEPAAAIRSADAPCAPSASHHVEQEHHGLRWQLANLFGIAPEQLEASARQREQLSSPPEETHHTSGANAVQTHCPLEADGVPEGKTPSERDGGLPPSQPPCPLVADPPSAHRSDSPTPPTAAAEDSVELYMQQLLSRLQTREPAAAEEPRSTSPGDGFPECSRTAPTADQAVTATAASPAEEATVPAPSRPPRRLDPRELAHLRANLDSMRQIANLSARSAVARHYAQKLEISLKIKVWLTIVAALVSLVLFSAKSWGRNSYDWQAFAAFQITLIASLELVRTLVRLRRVQKIAASDDGNESSPSRRPSAAEIASTETVR